MRRLGTPPLSARYLIHIAYFVQKHCKCTSHKKRSNRSRNISGRSCRPTSSSTRLDWGTSLSFSCNQTRCSWVRYTSDIQTTPSKDMEWVPRKRLGPVWAEGTARPK
jgi:hypothetical protein